MESYLPSEIFDFLENQIQQLISNFTKLTTAEAIIAMILAFYNASKGTKALIVSLNTIYEEKEGISFYRKIVKSFFGVLLLSIAFVIIIILLGVIPIVIKFLNLGKSDDSLVIIFTGLSLYLFVSAMLGMIYKYFPNRRKAKWRWITLGSTIATVFWGIGSFIFTWYVTNYANYSASYGVLGSFVVGMFWMYMTSYMILLGAQINAEIEHQTAIDTTIGEKQPIGERGAQMADTYGKSLSKKS